MASLCDSNFSLFLFPSLLCSIFICLTSIFSLSPHPPSLSTPSPQDFDLFLPAVLQCLAAAGPHRAVLRLAGGKHSPGGVAGRRAQRGHCAAGRGDGGSLPALRLLTAGKSKKATSSWKVPKTACPMNSVASWCLSVLVTSCICTIWRVGRGVRSWDCEHPRQGSETRFKQKPYGYIKKGTVAVKSSWNLAFSVKSQAVQLHINCKYPKICHSAYCVQ